MERYEKYKNSRVTWLGEIPEHWIVKKSRYLFSIKKRIVGKLGFDVLSITQQGIKVKNIDSKDGQIASDYSEYQLVEVGDFAMNSMDLLTGFVDIANQEGVTSPDYRVFTLVDNNSESRFFLYLFQLGYMRKIFYGFGRGAALFGRWRFPTDEFNHFLFPVPPLEEQKAITYYLDNKTAEIDELIAQKERLIQLYEEEKKAIINQAVSQGIYPNVKFKPSKINWLGDIPEHWEIVPMTKYLESIVDYRGRTPKKVESGLLLVTAKNIKNGKIDYSLSEEYVDKFDAQSLLDRGTPRIGDVLFTTEAPLGEVANVDKEDIALAQRVIKFRGQENILDNYFLKYWLMSDSFQQDLCTYATGSTALGIKASKLPKLLLLLPSIKEQKSIADYIENKMTQINVKIAKTKRIIELQKEYRMALISETVTGKIKVLKLVDEVA